MPFSTIAAYERVRVGSANLILLLLLLLQYMCKCANVAILFFEGERKDGYHSFVHNRITTRNRHTRNKKSRRHKCETLCYA